MKTVSELTNPGWTPGEWLWNLRRMARVCNTPYMKALLEERVKELEAAMAAEGMKNGNQEY